MMVGKNWNNRVGKNWNNKEIKSLLYYVWCGIDIKTISLKLWRNVNGVSIKINKLWLEKICPLCKWKKPKLNRFCNDCNKKKASENGKLRYSKNKHWYKEYRYEKYRFWWNYKKALDRDKWCCVVCWMANEEHVKKWWCSITVDHIDWTWRNDKKNINSKKTMMNCLIYKLCAYIAIETKMPRELHIS